MDVPQSKRREEITELFEKQDYVGLSKLGIIVVDDKAGNLDCGGYVLNQLGVDARQETYNILWSVPRYEQPFSGIIIYTDKHGSKKRVLQHGFYDGNRVTSKWGREGPVFSHAIEDVPVDYGDHAEFIVKDGQLLARLQETMMAVRSGGNSNLWY